jgi:uncharacterized protein
VLDTRELGRRPGSQRKLSLDVPAPAQLGIEFLGVPEGDLIHLDLRLEAVMEGVLLTGTASATLVGECVRCLDAISDDSRVSLQELYMYDAPDTDEDEDVSKLEDDLLDLEPLLRDAVVLALPFQPVCREDCPGLCPRMRGASRRRSRSPARAGDRPPMGGARGPGHRRTTPKTDSPITGLRRRSWLSRSGRCRVATPVTVARRGRPPRPSW